MCSGLTTRDGADSTDRFQLLNNEKQALRGIVWVISVFWLSASFVCWLGEQQRTANSQNTEITEITEITEPTPISKRRSLSYRCWFGDLRVLRVLAVSELLVLAVSELRVLARRATANSQNTEITEITEPTPISNQRSSWLFVESGG